MSLTLPRFSQENVLTLLVFSDSNALLIRNAISPSLFDSPYREIATKAIDYIDRYKIPPKQQIADELDDYIKDEKNGPVFQDVLKSMFSLQENLNSKYVVDKLTTFIRERKFEEALYDAAQLQGQGKIDEAQEVMRLASQFNLSIFDPGIRLTNLDLLFDSLEEEEIIPTGIRVLDEMKVGPARGEVYLLLAAYSRGKSWHGIQIGRMSMLLNYKVVHVTLEINQTKLLQRYWQCLLGLTRWQTTQTLSSPVFKKDGNNKLSEIKQEVIAPKSLEDPEARQLAESYLAKYGPLLENNMRIKAAPTGTLTLPDLRAYLDGLEQTENFIPDLLILDHGSQMKLPSQSAKDFRIGLGRLFVDLRGLAGTRNMAIATAHQLNKEGTKARVADGTGVSEDWSIMGTVDTGIVFNQKPMEKKTKIARLSVDRGRSMKSGFTVLITQNYDVGQFCLDSEMCPWDYSPTNDDGLVVIPEGEED